VNAQTLATEPRVKSALPLHPLTEMSRYIHFHTEPPAPFDVLRQYIVAGLAHVCEERGHSDLSAYLKTLLSQQADPLGHALWHFCACLSSEFSGTPERWAFPDEDLPVRIHNPVKFLRRLGVDDPELMDLFDTAFYCLPQEWDDNDVEKDRELQENWPDFRATLASYLDWRYYTNPCNFGLCHHCRDVGDEFIGRRKELTRSECAKLAREDAKYDRD
jgi:hypothetical protein